MFVPLHGGYPANFVNMQLLVDGHGLLVLRVAGLRLLRGLRLLERGLVLQASRWRLLVGV